MKSKITKASAEISAEAFLWFRNLFAAQQHITNGISGSKAIREKNAYKAVLGVKRCYNEVGLFKVRSSFVSRKNTV